MGTLLCSSAAWSENVVVVMNNENANTVDLAYIARIYSGALKAWPDGSPVFALDQTGKGLPQKVVSADLEMKRLVATNRNAIGYILASQVDNTVKVIEK